MFLKRKLDHIFFWTQNLQFYKNYKMVEQLITNFDQEELYWSNWSHETRLKGAERWLVNSYNMAGKQDAEQQHQASLHVLFTLHRFPWEQMSLVSSFLWVNRQSVKNWGTVTPKHAGWALLHAIQSTPLGCSNLSFQMTISSNIIVVIENQLMVRPQLEKHALNRLHFLQWYFCIKSRSGQTTRLI